MRAILNENYFEVEHNGQKGFVLVSYEIANPKIKGQLVLK
jgi:hypothetical protein